MPTTLPLALLTILLLVQATGPGRAFKGKPQTIPGTVEAEDFDEGGEGVAYHDLDPENQEKHRPAYRDGGVDLERRAAATQGYNLGWTRAGEWLLYTVDVAAPGTYRLEMLVASKGAGGTLHLEFDGVDRTGPITIPDTGGWQHLKLIEHDGVKLEKGRAVMKVVMRTDGASGSVGDIDFFRFSRR
jgi:hypothetical protein